VSATVIHERLIRAGDGLAEQAITWGEDRAPGRPVALTERDLRLMVLLHDVNYLSASQLALLGWGRDSNAACRRLRLLFASGRLDRFRAPVRVGRSEWNYRVSRRGWQALADRGLTSEERYRPAELHSISYAEHDLQLNGMVLHLAQAAAPPGATGLIDRMPFVWLGPRTGRIEPMPFGRPAQAPGLPPGTRLHHEQSRAGYLEPDATLIGDREGQRFAVLIEYERTRRPHKQLDRLRRYDRWLLDEWEEGRYADHVMPPTLLLLTDRDGPLPGLVQAADQAFTAWHAPPHTTAAHGTHPARQRTIITSRARILRGDWTMRRPPNLPPDVRSGGSPAPRGIDYDLAALLARL
jgi:hypothetical protein